MNPMGQYPWGVIGAGPYEWGVTGGSLRYLVNSEDAIRAYKAVVREYALKLHTTPDSLVFSRTLLTQKVNP